MASQVPYNPVPSVAPTTQPTPYESVNTPPAAFGAATAQAISHLGEVGQQVGNEVFSRAIAMQQMSQDADANKAAADFATELAKRTADFRSLQGKQAVDALPQYRDDINNLREQIRGNLTSPYAQRAYDADTRRNQSYTEFSIASHAADQLKHYSIETAHAQVKSMRDLTLVNPKDEDMFQQNLKGTEAKIRETAPQLGLSGDALEQNILEAKSGLWRDRITELAKNEPWAATEVLKKGIADKALAPDDLDKATVAVRKSQLDIGSRNMGHDVMTGALFGRQIVSRDMARAGIAWNEQDSREYNTVGVTVPQNNSHPEGQALGRYAVMSYNLSPWLAEASKAGVDVDPTMSKEQFLADPKAQDKLFDFKFGQYQKSAGSFDGAADLWFGKGSTDGYHNHDWYLSKAHATLARVASRNDLDEAVRGEAKRLAPDNPDLPDAASSRVQTIKSRQMQLQRDQEYHDNATLTNALVAGRGQDGKLPLSVDELTQDPEVKAAWDRAKPSDRLRIYKEFERYAKDGDYGYTPANQKQFHQIYGALTEPQMSAEDREKALGINMWDLPMPAGQRKILQDTKDKLFNKIQADPNMTKAMSSIQDMTSGVLDKKYSPDDYNLFWGSFRLAIQDRMQDEKKPLTSDETRKIASGLLRNIAQPTWGGLFHRDTPAYRMPVDPAMKNNIIEKFRAQGIEPTEAQISQAWNVLQLRMYDGKASTSLGSSSWKPMEPTPPSGD